MKKKATNISDPGIVSTHLRLQRLRELLAASIEKGGELDETLPKIFNSLDEIEKENEELLRMNEDLTTSCRSLAKAPDLPSESLDPSSRTGTGTTPSNAHLTTDLAPCSSRDYHEGVTPEADHSISTILDAQQFRCLAERFRDGFVLADEEGCIIEWNQAEEDITGLTRVEVLGRSIWDVSFQVGIAIDERDNSFVYEETKAMYLHLIKKGKSPSLDKIVEIEIQRPNGVRCNIQMSYFVIQTAKGFMSGSITRDITELKKTIAALKESSLQLGNQKQFTSRILESIPSSLVVIDRSMRVVSVNHNFLEKTHRKEQATLGHKLDLVFPKELLRYTNLTQRVQEVFQTGRLVDGGKVTYHASGQPNRVYYFRLFPIFLTLRNSGEKTAVAEQVENAMLLMDDVTEREQLGKEMRSVERHLASVVECANDLVVSLDPKGNIRTWNRAAEVTSGIKSELVEGHSLISVCSPDQQLVMTNMLDRLVHIGSVQHTETNLLTASSKEVPISWSCSLMRDDTSKVAGIVAVGRDLTELRLMEDKLLESAKMASLGVMAGGIAHDLRNPLGIISACTQLLLDNPKNSEFSTLSLQKIYAATRRGSKIIENLLKFARPAGGWVKKEVNLHAVIDETLALLANQITSQKVIVSVTYQPDLPHLLGSHEMLQQVFANLVLNACNAMPKGGLLKIAVEANSAGQVEIRFMDTGCGIPPENLSKIFDPFFTTMPVGKGVGLGLSISHTFIQQHQGVIEVHSEVGKGSSFIVRLPGIL
ncbi:PAS domain-containing sensor histidine kinase [bacterium]|nr:MAG: PAS domain-containing sensor histidine kinase [bacterium]